MALAYDPEFEKVFAPLREARAGIPLPAVHDVEARRTNAANGVLKVVESMPAAADVVVTGHTAKSADGHEVIITQIAKNDTGATAKATPGPAVVYMHSGGLYISRASSWHNLCTQQVSATGVQFFSVDYRLAPESPAPAAINDVYAALEYVHSNASKLGVDPARIAVYGESAGGGLAAACAILARERNLSPPLKKQILIYPMLDPRNVKPVSELAPFLTWSVDDNVTGWTAYLGEKVVQGDKADVPGHLAPAMVKSVEGLPACYIDCGTLDLFRDESVEYATRLREANIACELHLYPNVPHVFELLAPQHHLTVQATTNRRAALKSL